MSGHNEVIVSGGGQASLATPRPPPAPSAGQRSDCLRRRCACAPGPVPFTA